MFIARRHVWIFVARRLSGFAPKGAKIFLLSRIEGDTTSGWQAVAEQFFVTDPVATVSIPIPSLPPALRGGPPRIQAQNPPDEGDIPRAVPPEKKPAQP